METRVVVGRDHTETRDPAEVEHLINTRYVSHRPRMLGHVRRLVFDSQAAWAGGLTVDQMTYGASVEIHADPFDTFLIVGLTSGRFELTAGSATDRVDAGGSLLYPVGMPLDVRIEQATMSIAQIPADAVARLADRLGVGPADFRLDGMRPVSPAMNGHWRATVEYLARSFAGPEPPVSHPLILSAVMEAAAASLLTAFPNTTMTLGHIGRPGRVAPAAVRRATAYIDAHAGEPITLEDIAAAAGVKVRGLQAAFARHRDISPMGYLRRVRMERAHRDLAAGCRGRGDTVAGIARRWGFAAPGRFAVEYRKTFGRSPGQTLGA